MTISVSLIRKISEVDQPLRELLFAILEEMEKQRAQWEESVTKKEFNELKEIVRDIGQSVKDLAEAQKKTEQRLDELAKAQKKTEQRLDSLTEKVEQLAEAQKKTEEEIKKLAVGLNRVRKEIGGLSRTVSYALENEAYRHLPKFLKEHFGLEITERLIRTYIEDLEINIFGKVKKDGKEHIIVGETVLKLDDSSKIKQVWNIVGAVKEKMGGDVIPIIVTHFAKPTVLKKAQKAGIIVIQSFEWL